MISLPLVLALAHLIGLALAMGGATAKFTLLIRCKADHALVPAYLAVARPITRLIILGLILLTVSGIAWLILGYDFTTVLFVKLALVLLVWIIGPVIDNVAEPKFRNLAPGPGESPSPAFMRAQQQYVLLEAVATGAFYVIVVMWIVA